jgi:transcription elongation factor Elf1
MPSGAKMLAKKNRTRSPKNMKRRDWLLSSLITCARCGYTYYSIIGGSKKSPIGYYGCR